MFRDGPTVKSLSSLLHRIPAAVLLRQNMSAFPRAARALYERQCKHTRTRTQGVKPVETRPNVSPVLPQTLVA